MERARKTDLENGMVWYVSMKTYWDMKNIKLAKSRKSAESAKKMQFSMWNISISFHRNISNHTIFLISFSSSFHWCYLYTHLINSEKYFFQAMRDLTIELSKWWQKWSFPGLWSMQLFYRHCWDPKWWFAGKYIYDYIFSIKLTFLFYFPWTIRESSVYQKRSYQHIGVFFLLRTSIVVTFNRLMW